jgi:hypothetical protein
MLKLIKYELRKNVSALIIVAGIFALLQVFYAYNLFRARLEKSEIMLFLCVFAIFASIIVLSMVCVTTYSKDLKTRQSYMLFMTPNSSYSIVGSKLITTALEILLSFAAGCGIIVADLYFLCQKFPSIGNTMDMINEILGQFFNEYAYSRKICMALAAFALGWILFIIDCLGAITLSSTFMANNKAKGIVSFLLLLLLCYIESKLLYFVTDTINSKVSFGNANLFTYTMAGSYITMLVLMVGLYFGISYMLDRKVSL